VETTAKKGALLQGSRLQQANMPPFLSPWSKSHSEVGDWPRRLTKIKAIGHIIGGAITGSQRRQPEQGLAELEQADVRMPHLRDVPAFRIGAQHHTTDA